ncbi:MAG: hypothetical protein AMXMBFR12_03850 [Candidatus Babeliales bacterium]
MNSSFTLALALLISSVPYTTFASDRCPSDKAQMACDCRETNSRLVANTDDAKVFLSYLIGKELLEELPRCDFNALGRLKKFLKKYVLNRVFLNDSINITLDLPSAGQVTVLNTDQFLEVALVVIHDLLAKRTIGDVVVDGVVTLTREEVVAFVVWLLGQTNVEELAPSVTNTRLYQETRNEVARYYVDKGIAHVRN